MKIFSILVFLFFVPILLSAQEGQPGAESNIAAQFEEIMEKSSNYKNYEVVRQDWLLDLRDLTLQKIASLNEEIETNKQTIDNLNKEVAGLNARISSLDAELTASNEEKSSIGFFGTPIEKSTYKSIMWGIVIFLALLTAFFAFRFRGSNVLTREAQKNLAETEAEFEEFRQKSLEKQQELGRKLQDERNKRSKMA